MLFSILLFKIFKVLYIEQAYACEIFREEHQALGLSTVSSFGISMMWFIKFIVGFALTEYYSILGKYLMGNWTDHWPSSRRFPRSGTLISQLLFRE